MSPIRSLSLCPPVIPGSSEAVQAHRGSGRISASTIVSNTIVSSHRGSGRLGSGPQAWRGSGRIQNLSPGTGMPQAWRGSGRIAA